MGRRQSSPSTVSGLRPTIRVVSWLNKVIHPLSIKRRDPKLKKRHTLFNSSYKEFFFSHKRQANTLSTGYW